MVAIKTSVILYIIRANKTTNQEDEITVVIFDPVFNRYRIFCLVTNTNYMFNMESYF